MSAQQPAAAVPLQCWDLEVGYGAAVLRGVTLTIARGEVAALIGRNGSGKTTLLRALAGLVRPHAGRIAWHGRERLPDGPSRPRALGLVLQHEPAPWLPVRDVLRLGGAPAETLDALIERHRLQPLALRRVSELSGCERQRVSLARADAAQPGLYLLDEPTNHLDREEHLEFRRWLDAARARAGVLLITHDDRLIARADRTLTADAGRVR